MHWCNYLLALAAPALALPLAAPATYLPKAMSRPKNYATEPCAKAIWLWNSDIILDDAKVDTFLTKMTNKERPFKTVLALIDRDMGFDPWVSFVKKCNAKGLEVEALMGDVQWVVGKTTDDGPTLEHELNWVQQYQAKAGKDAQLTGIHLDVEPWSLDGFEENKAEYVSSLVEIVSRVKEVAKPLGLPVGADLPFWANKVPCKNAHLDTCLLNDLDYVTFMTYRNTADSLLGIADPVLKAVKAVDSNKPVWLSVETSSKPAEVSLISYAGKTASALFTDLAKVSTVSKSKGNNFAGIAVHSYEDFEHM